MRYLYTFGLLFCPTLVVFAEEVAEAVTPAMPPIPPDAPWWVQLVWPILFVVVMPFVVGYLRKKKAAAIAEAEKIELDSSKSLMEQKNLLIDKRVIPYLWATAEHLAAKNLPVVLADALDGDGKFDWKKHAGGLKDELLTSLKEKFKAEGIDIVKVLGEKYLGELLDRAIQKAIPWLPQASQNIVGSIAEGKGKFLAGMIVDKGLDIAKAKWLEDKLESQED